jgi:hypothetical protein
VAYDTNESGRYQVVVQPFPDASGGKWQISTEGGSVPKWRRDGRELYYLSPSGEMVAVAVTTDSAFTIGKSTRLFQIPVAPNIDPASLAYDAAADGQRFLISSPVASSNTSPISVILNWPSALKP